MEDKPSTGPNSASATDPEDRLKLAPASEPPRTLRQYIKATWTRAVALWALACIPLAVYYLWLPHWEFVLPSRSYQPKNPFRAVFTFKQTHTVPAADVSVRCMQLMLEYTEPQSYSANIPSRVYTAEWIAEGAQIDVLCDAVVTGVRFFNRRLSAEEKTQMFLKGPPKPNDPTNITWADFEFTLSYKPMPFVPWQWTHRRRAIGEIDHQGDFVWREVSVNEAINRPSYDALRKQPR